MPRSIHIPVHNPLWSAATGHLHSLFESLRAMHAERRAASRLLDCGARLVADAGWTVEDAEVAAGRPVWQSRHVPPLRYL